MLLLSSTLTSAEEKLLALLQVALSAAGLVNITPMLDAEDALTVGGIFVSETTTLSRSLGGRREVPAWYIYELRHDAGDRETPPDTYDHEIATVTSEAEAVKTIVLYLITEKIEAAMNRHLFPNGAPEDEDFFPDENEPYYHPLSLDATVMTSEDFEQSDFAFDAARERRSFR